MSASIPLTHQMGAMMTLGLAQNRSGRNRWYSRVSTGMRADLRVGIVQRIYRPEGLAGQVQHRRCRQLWSGCRSVGEQTPPRTRPGWSRTTLSLQEESGVATDRLRCRDTRRHFMPPGRCGRFINRRAGVHRRGAQNLLRGKRHRPPAAAITERGRATTPHRGRVGQPCTAGGGPPSDGRRQLVRCVPVEAKGEDPVTEGGTDPTTVATRDSTDGVVEVLEAGQVITTLSAIRRCHAEEP